MQTVIMFLWCFVLRVIPFKKIVFGALCIVVLNVGVHFAHNHTIGIADRKEDVKFEGIKLFFTTDAGNDN